MMQQAALKTPTSIITRNQPLFYQLARVSFLIRSCRRQKCHLGLNTAPLASTSKSCSIVVVGSTALVAISRIVYAIRRPLCRCMVSIRQVSRTNSRSMSKTIMRGIIDRALNEIRRSLTLRIALMSSNSWSTSERLERRRMVRLHPCH